VRALESGAAAWLRGAEPEGRTGADECVQQVVWVYRAVNAVAEQVANVPFLFSRGERGRENLVTSARCGFLCAAASAVSRFEYWELRVIWLIVARSVSGADFCYLSPNPSPNRIGRGEMLPELAKTSRRRIEKKANPRSFHFHTYPGPSARRWLTPVSQFDSARYAGFLPRSLV